MIYRVLYPDICKTQSFLCFGHECLLKRTRRIDKVVRVVNHNLLFLRDILPLFMQINGLYNGCHKGKVEVSFRICDRLVCLSFPLVVSVLRGRVVHTMS